MSIPKLLLFVSVVLFGFIGIAALKKGKKEESATLTSTELSAPIQVQLTPVTPPAQEVSTSIVESKITPIPTTPIVKEEKAVKKTSIVSEQQPISAISATVSANMNVDRINEFFNIEGQKLPIVETITYKSKVSWSPGKPAWVSDYASHYHTSRHFIARSLNGAPDYFKQDVANGDQFNVFRADKNFEFNLIVDLTQCKLGFYYHDLDTNERVLLKTYSVGVGREDAAKASGYLTPLGKFTLGDRVAIYHPTTTGFYNGKKTELVKVFGSRWIPFEKEVEGCTASPKGFGIHGVPWAANANGVLAEDLSSLGKHASDGCIRLSTDDINEIYSIVISRPTTIEIVKSGSQAPQLVTNQSAEK